MFKAKGKRQKAKGKNIKPPYPNKDAFFIFAFCLLPFAF